MVRVKVCGITREEDLRAAIDAGADAVGFIVGFPSSPRNLTVEKAGALIRRVPPLASAVLVTTAEALAQEKRTVRAMGPQAVQLYGEVDDPEEVRESVGARLIRPYLVARRRPAGIKRQLKGYDALLTDTYRRGFAGGTGAVSDWGVCGGIQRAIAPTPMILSGGLNPENVARAVAAVRPFAVDVSSGVESSPGVKDAARVAAFVRRAKGAD